MTTEQLTELRRLLAEATPGPWQVVNVDTGGKTDRAKVTRRTYIKPIPKGIPLADISGGSNPQEANAALIAAAVNALPDLLAAVEREAKLRETLLNLTNRAENQAVRLALLVPPSHCDYVSKTGAANNLKQAVKTARAALAEGGDK